MGESRGKADTQTNMPSYSHILLKKKAVFDVKILTVMSCRESNRALIIASRTVTKSKEKSSWELVTNDFGFSLQYLIIKLVLTNLPF